MLGLGRLNHPGGTTTMKTLVTITATALLLFSAVIEAQQTRRTTNKGGGFACLTESAYDELTQAILHAQKTKDTSWAKSLLDSTRCFSMKKGLQVTIKDYEFLGVSEIYLHPPGGGAPVAVWTANENFQE